MPFAIEMFFDKEADLRIRQIWSKLANNKISSKMQVGGYRPHISLAVFEDYKQKEFDNMFKNFVQELPSLSLSLENIGIFPTDEGVVFLGVVITQELLSIHNNLHRMLSTLVSNSRQYYHPDKWIPHCTLAIDLKPNKLIEAVRLCSKENLPITLQIHQIGIVEVPIHKEILVENTK